ncbi:MAG TPA: glucosamine-6-phosphate deaminase [Candidatus Sumerlaeota bacterium]|nr:glucosamine-6-phosphate deaminase [Candidatus Sumerlaeota bacterium]
MNLHLLPSRTDMGAQAARTGADRIRETLGRNGAATIILATGASQFDMLDALVREAVDWPRVTAFHLDEYIGLPRTHPASFRRYLKERFVDRLPRPVRQFHFIEADEDPEAECARLVALIEPVTVDVAFIGIGENGHLAFNDPPADFETHRSYQVADLDEACRRQQMGEGWFATLDAVPRQAITMSIPRLMAARTIVCTVPDARKADAVWGAVEGPVTPDVPASILQRHGDCHLFLDPPAAARLGQGRLGS